MKKRMVSLLLCAAFSLSLIMTGCGGNENQTDSAPGEESEGQEAGGITEKEVTFTWLHHLQEDGKKAWVQYCVDTYMEQHPNVTINVEMQNTDNFMTVLKTKVGSGDAPMIFDLEPVYLTEFQKAGHLADVSDTEGLENFSEDLLIEGQREGKQYGVPLDANSFNAFYNKDVFEKYNLSVPTTLSEFEQVCQTLKENDVIPIAVGFSELWTMRRYSNIYTDVACVSDNPNWFTDKMDLTSSFSEDQAFKDSIKMFMSYKPYWGNDPFGTKQNDALSQVATGEAAMIICGTWTIDGILAINPDVNIGSFALPTSEDPSGAIMEMKPGNSFCVYNTEDPDLMAVAKDFFTFMCSKESAEYYAINAHSITGCNIDVENIDALNEITAYEGEQVYTMSGITGFTSEYQDIVFETMQKYAMEDEFDVDKFCEELDRAFSSVQ